jgi:hypothetical protein
VSMVMSTPRTSYWETLQWVRKFCGSFSILWNYEHQKLGY